MSFGAAFLRHPDLFPARRAGEAWGDRALVLAVPGGPYRLSGLAPSQEEGLRRRFGPLCAPAGEPAEELAGGAAVQVFRAPPADFLPIDTRGWEYTLDLDPAPAALRVAGLQLMARLDGPAAAGALWTPQAAGEEWTSVCENVLRVLTAYRLLDARGALLHSAGVSDGERAWLLLGPSGAGKTTASRLCLDAGADVLSDDLNAVLLPAAGPPRVARLPFTGDLGERTGAPGAWPLQAVLRLRQGPATGLARLSRASALAALVAAAPFVNHDPWRREPLLAVLEEVAFAVPAWELTFSLGAGLWSILREIP